MQAAEYAAHAALEDEHWWFKARRNIIAAMMDQYAPQQRGHLLEIGCGTGGNLKFFASRFGAVTGIDVAADAVRHAQQRVPGEILHGDFRSIPRERWTNFDVVLLADVLEHVADDRTLMQDVAARLRAGATLVVTVPAHPALSSAHDIALGHYRRYTMPMFQTLWAGLPLQPLFVSPFNSLLLPLIGLVRVVSSRDGNARSDLKRHGAFANTLLYHVFNLETRLLQHASLPWGCSYVAVLRKEGTHT